MTVTKVSEASLTEQRDRAWRNRDRLYMALERLYLSLGKLDPSEFDLACEGARNALGYLPPCKTR